jgi:hypothetical protein
MLLRKVPGLELDERLLELTSADEIWARSFAQFVAMRSGDLTLMAELAELRTGSLRGMYYLLQWTDEDFRPIADEIEALFEELGWIT